MDDFLKDIKKVPLRIAPYVLLGQLNEPVPALSGPWDLIGPSRGRLHSDLVFRWLPSPSFLFEGDFPSPHPDIDAEWFLESTDEQGLKIPVMLTHVSVGAEAAYVRGMTKGTTAAGDSPFETLRFSLANFPDYLGAPFRYEKNGSISVVAGRLEFESELGLCRVDSIPEANELRKDARRESGFVVSHVGEWIPKSGKMSTVEAETVLHMLHFWFGFLRGAWSGPVFPQGVTQGDVVWQHIAPWLLNENRAVPTWLPQKNRLDLSPLFSAFVEKWSDSTWQGALISSISWLMEANAARTGLEATIVLSQVAVELISWLDLVETQRLQSRADFKRLSAAGRIRSLLQHCDIPLTLPDHMSELNVLVQGDAFDGPGVLTRVRNALVHATEDNRAVTDSLGGVVLYKCAQLGLQYLELALLSILGYRGPYARRGWQGWKGDDETIVTWMKEG